MKKRNSSIKKNNNDGLTIKKKIKKKRTLFNLYHKKSIFKRKLIEKYSTARCNFNTKPIINNLNLKLKNKSSNRQDSKCKQFIKKKCIDSADPEISLQSQNDGIHVSKKNIMLPTNKNIQKQLNNNEKIFKNKFLFGEEEKINNTSDTTNNNEKKHLKTSFIVSKARLKIVPNKIYNYFAEYYKTGKKDLIVKKNRKKKKTRFTVAKKSKLNCNNDYSYHNPYNESIEDSDNFTHDENLNQEKMGMLVYLGVNRPLFPLVCRNIVNLCKKDDVLITDSWAEFSLSVLITKPCENKVKPVFVPVIHKKLLASISDCNEKYNTDGKEIEIIKYKSISKLQNINDLNKNLDVVENDNENGESEEIILHKKRLVADKFSKRPNSEFIKKHNNCSLENEVNSSNTSENTGTNNFRCITEDTTQFNCSILPVSKESDSTISMKKDVLNTELTEDKLLQIGLRSLKECSVLVPKIKLSPNGKYKNKTELVNTDRKDGKYKTEEGNTNENINQYCNYSKKFDLKQNAKDSLQNTDGNTFSNELENKQIQEGSYNDHKNEQLQCRINEGYYYGDNYCSRTYGQVVDYVSRNRSLVYFYKMRRILNSQKQNNKYFKSCIYTRINCIVATEIKFVDIMSDLYKNCFRRPSDCINQPATTFSSDGLDDIFKLSQNIDLKNLSIEDSNFSFETVDTYNLKSVENVRWLTLVLNKEIIHINYAKKCTLPFNILFAALFKAELSKKVVCGVIDTEYKTNIKNCNLKFGVYAFPGICDTILLGPYSFQESHKLSASIKLLDDTIMDVSVRTGIYLTSDHSYKNKDILVTWWCPIKTLRCAVNINTSYLNSFFVSTSTSLNDLQSESNIQITEVLEKHKCKIFYEYGFNNTDKNFVLIHDSNVKLNENGLGQTENDCFTQNVEIKTNKDRSRWRRSELRKQKHVLKSTMHHLSGPSSTPLVLNEAVTMVKFLEAQSISLESEKCNLKSYQKSLLSKLRSIVVGSNDEYKKIRAKNMTKNDSSERSETGCDDTTYNKNSNDLKTTIQNGKTTHDESKRYWDEENSVMKTCIFKKPHIPENEHSSDKGYNLRNRQSTIKYSENFSGTKISTDERINRAVREKKRPARTTNKFHDLGVILEKSTTEVDHESPTDLNKCDVSGNRDLRDRSVNNYRRKRKMTKSRRRDRNNSRLFNSLTRGSNTAHLLSEHSYCHASDSASLETLNNDLSGPFEADLPIIEPENSVSLGNAKTNENPIQSNPACMILFQDKESNLSIELSNYPDYIKIEIKFQENGKTLANMMVRRINPDNVENLRMMINKETIVALIRTALMEIKPKIINNMTETSLLRLKSYDRLRILYKKLNAGLHKIKNAANRLKKNGIGDVIEISDEENDRNENMPQYEGSIRNSENLITEKQYDDTSNDTRRLRINNASTSESCSLDHSFENTRHGFVETYGLLGDESNDFDSESAVDTNQNAHLCGEEEVEEFNNIENVIVDEFVTGNKNNDPSICNNLETTDLLTNERPLSSRKDITHKIQHIMLKPNRPIVKKLINSPKKILPYSNNLEASRKIFILPRSKLKILPAKQQNSVGLQRYVLLKNLKNSLPITSKLAHVSGNSFNKKLISILPNPVNTSQKNNLLKPFSWHSTHRSSLSSENNTNEIEINKIGLTCTQPENEENNVISSNEPQSSHRDNNKQKDGENYEPCDELNQNKDEANSRTGIVVKSFASIDSFKRSCLSNINRLLNT